MLENSRYLSILIVDDDKDLASVMADICAPYFHRVSTANSGLEAIQVIKKEYIDLMLCDLCMPEMDGIQLFQEVYEKIDNTIVKVIITGYPDFASASKAFEYGAADYLGKPIDPKELEMKLERACRRRLQILDQERQVLEIIGDLNIRSAMQKSVGKCPEERLALFEGAERILELKRSRYLAIRASERVRLLKAS